MIQIQTATSRLARGTRTAFARRAVRAAAITAVAAAALGTAGASYASTAPHHVRPDGYAPIEECLTLSSATVQAFPALTTTSHAVTAVINGTLGSCNSEGTGQTFSGSVFGTLTGTATKTRATLSGNVAVTWPSDSNLNPTIAPISITASANNQYSIDGTISAGAGTGDQLWGSYDVISTSKINGGTQETLTAGTTPFGIYVNEG
jgi:hypothetical protein